MKKYKVEVSKDNPDLRDLVNIDAPEERIPVAPDNFEDGQEVTEDMFFMREANYVDDEGTGTIDFAFELSEIEKEDIVELLKHFYETDLENCAMSHDEWINELAEALTNPEYLKTLILKYNEYLEEINA